jgi:peptide/nickel transport system permease protein
MSIKGEDKKRRRARVLRLVPLVLLLGTALVLTLVLPSHPATLDPSSAWAAPSAAHPLGAGEGGSDLLLVVAHATLRGSLLALSVALFGGAVGVPVGAIAAMLRGRAESWVSRTCDLLQAFPSFLFAITVLAAVKSPTRLHLGIAFALTAWVPFARLSLAETRVLRGQSFIEASRALGATQLGLLFRHVLPNLMGTVAVQLGATAAAIVVGEAALAFVGLASSDRVSLGCILDQGVASMLRAPSVLLVGAVSVFALSTSMMLAGRAADR